MDVALQMGMPRIEVELPPGLRLGVEGVQDELVLSKSSTTPERIAKGDRELAACMLLLFAESKELCVAFRTGALVSAAKRAWQDWGRSRVLAFPRGSGPRASSFGLGAAGEVGQSGAEAMRAALARAGCSTLVVVAPRAEQLRAVAELDSHLGAETRIILLNPRVRSLARRDKLRARIAAAFNPVFHLRLAGPGGRGLVYRAAVKGRAAPWILAQRRLPGTPLEELSRSEEEPSGADLEAAFGSGSSPQP